MRRAKNFSPPVNIEADYATQLTFSSNIIDVHYLFLDETYRDAEPDRKAIIVGAWAAEQDRLNKRVKLLRELRNRGKSPFWDRMNFALEALDGLAIVAAATLDRSLFRAGEMDGTDDIEAMARPDNIWSVSVSFAIANLIKEIGLRRRHVDTVDVYFDPKSLKPGHANAIKRFLRETFPRQIRHLTRPDEVFKRLSIRHVEQVPKSMPDEEPTKLQLGTWMADRLCSQATHCFDAGGSSRIKAVNMSEVVRRTLQQYEGKSFQDDP